MVLPDSFHRKTTKLTEEVDIPHTEASTTNVGDKRVRIDDLDEVGSTLNNKNNMKWTFLTPRPSLQMSGTRESESMI